VVRFRNPDSGEVAIEDQIQGLVTYQNKELDDLIIARADGTPTYNLTVVVDDMDMAITHVIRGDDHLNNTPRQINIFNALKITPPIYAHVPMILGPDGKKLSKRHGTVSVLQYRDEGILPEALLNYLVRLGWSHGDQEVFSREEMINLFDIKDVNKAAAALNPDKLLWLNQHYLKQGDTGRLADLLGDAMHEQGITVELGPNPEDLFLVQRERFNNLIEMANKSRCFYEEITNYDQTSAENFLKPEAIEPLRRLQQEFEGIADWRDETIHSALTTVAESLGLKLGKIAQPLRVALTGAAVSPSIDKTVRLLGRERTLSRLKRAIEFIEGSRIIP
jgi:glutamyl-tRNA synthetase